MMDDKQAANGANDDRARVVSAMDQSGQWLEEFAGVLGQYYAALIRNGFSAEQATTLVGQYQMMMIGSLLARKPDGDGA